MYICLLHHCLKTCPGLDKFPQVNFHHCQSNDGSNFTGCNPLFELFQLNFLNLSSGLSIRSAKKLQGLPRRDGVFRLGFAEEGFLPF